MHKKKIIAPIVITAIIILYYNAFALVCIFWDAIPPLLKILGAIIPAIIAIFCVLALIERIKEIKTGEEDDISKY